MPKAAFRKRSTVQMDPVERQQLDEHGPRVCVVLCARGRSQERLIRTLVDALPGGWDCIVSVAERRPLDLPSHVRQICYDDESFSGKTIGHAMAIQLAMCRDEYEYIYVSMQDAVPRPGCLRSLLEYLEAHPEAGVAVPMFYTAGRLNIDGQWAKMPTCQVAHFEYISFLARAGTLAQVGPPDPTMATGWGVCCEFPMRCWKAGWAVAKVREAVCDHLGGTTWGATPGTPSRQAYHMRGQRELQTILQRYDDPEEFFAEADRMLERLQAEIPDESVKRFHAWCENQNNHLGAPGRWAPGATRRNRRRIQLIWWAVHQGGIERVFSLIARRLIAEGHEVEFLHWDHRERGRTFYGVPTRQIESGHAHSILEGMRAFRPDVVMYYSFAEIGRAARLYNASRVIEYMNGKSATLSIIGNGMRRADWICAWESQLGMDEFSGNPAFDGAQHIHIPAPIEWPMDLPSRAELDLPRGVRLITRIGRVVPGKGVEPFLDCMRGLGPEWHGLLVGGSDHTDGYLNALETQCKQEKLPVTCYGNVDDRRTLYGLIKKSFVMLSTSRGDEEGVSNAILESLQMGVPVIATDSGYSREVVIDGKTGVLLDRDAHGATFAAAIRELADNPARHRRLHDGALRLIAERHDESRTYDVWSQLLSGSTREVDELLIAHEKGTEESDAGESALGLDHTVATARRADPAAEARTA